MSNIKNDGLDQYGAGPFEQQQFGTAGVEGVKGQRCQLVTLGHPGLTYILYSICDHAPECLEVRN